MTVAMICRNDTCGFIHTDTLRMLLQWVKEMFSHFQISFLMNFSFTMDRWSLLPSFVGLAG
ncbi:unnamed protein product [Musa acuminata subsp. burmannicoides]